MEPSLIAGLVLDLLVVLVAGLISGALCKRLGISMLVGYLAVGTLIGPGAGALLTGANHELEHLARAGALLLLFSIGIEFSLEELLGLSVYFVVGGSVQMVLVAVPVIAVAMLLGMAPGGAVLVGAAAALSSTVLVFKALEEWGQVATGHGRRALGILLFQDVALVPLLLLIPMLAGQGEAASASAFASLALRSALFIALVWAVRQVIGRWGVPLLAALRSVELVVLFTVTVLVCACLGAYAIDLPPALGALAAGVVLSGNRLSGQFDALMLPYRETFAAVFFVSLGTLMRFDVLWNQPLLAFGGLLGVLVLKTAAAAAALWLTRLRWRAALGMGLGLAQLGELSFILLAVGTGGGGKEAVIDADTYNLMLFIALGTLILTPQLLKVGLRWVERSAQSEREAARPMRPRQAARRAVVVGLGPIGRRLASQLETTGIDVGLVDLSPVNLHPFAQQGFRTVAGDAADVEILRHADTENCRLAVVTVPQDHIAVDVVSAIRRLNPSCTILVRCRYQTNATTVQKAGADAVVIEETEAAGALLRLLPVDRPPVESGPFPDGS